MRNETARVARLSALAGLAALLAVPMLLGCDSIFGLQDCTLIGCDTGVDVRLTGAVPPVFEISLTPAGQEAQVIECENAVAGWCVEGVFFQGVTASDAVLEVRWDEGGITRSVRLEYDRFQPNGPRCGPICYLARLEVEF